MQNYKKEGLSEDETQFIDSYKGVFVRGIPKYFVTSSKIELEHLQCYICQNIIWKAVTCTQPGCFTNCCQHCVVSYEIDSDQQCKCPKCQKKQIVKIYRFHKTKIPLLNNLLSQITFKCPYYNNCDSKIPYDSYLKHSINCGFRKLECQGCHSLFYQKEIINHKSECSEIIVSCQKCSMRLPQLQFKGSHNEVVCLERQLSHKTQKITLLENRVESLKEKLDEYQDLIGKIMRGESLPVKIQFYTSFPTNFIFTKTDVKLIRSSWNTIKQKYDFLHFYVTSAIKTQSPIGFQWKLQVNVLEGNLLIGICSSLSINSVDFVINRFGEIKKKQCNQNKYKLIRKSNMTFSQNDIITFRYITILKVLRIENETKKVNCKLESNEISELGQNLYSFYSMDTVGDNVRFL